MYFQNAQRILEAQNKFMEKCEVKKQKKITEAQEGKNNQVGQCSGIRNVYGKISKARPDYNRLLWSLENPQKCETLEDQDKLEALQVIIESKLLQQFKQEVSDFKNEVGITSDEEEEAENTRPILSTLGQKPFSNHMKTDDNQMTPREIKIRSFGKSKKEIQKRLWLEQNTPGRQREPRSILKQPNHA